MSLKAILDCLQTQKENSEIDTAKLCLIDDGINGACVVTVPPNGLTKTATGGTLVLDGDVTANFPADQNVDLQNANGESCGEAVVASSVYSEETGKTTVTLSSCALDEGKDPAGITGAKPVPALVKVAIKTVKTFAARTAVKEVIVKEPVKEAVVATRSRR